jgi:CopZ-like zinc binding protein
MTSCCCPGPVDETTSSASCPVSGSPGTNVDLLTVKALLTEHALRRLVPGVYRFCPDASCEVVYFNAQGDRFTTADVRVPVWQKLPFGDRPICYCFGESEASIRSEIELTGTSTAIERIRDHIDAERCACEVRNPRGACCLGDVTAAVKRVETSIATTNRVR